MGMDISIDIVSLDFVAGLRVDGCRLVFDESLMPGIPAIPGIPGIPGIDGGFFAGGFCCDRADDMAAHMNNGTMSRERITVESREIADAKETTATTR